LFSTELGRALLLLCNHLLLALFGETLALLAILLLLLRHLLPVLILLPLLVLLLLSLLLLLPIQILLLLIVGALLLLVPVLLLLLLNLLLFVPVLLLLRLLAVLILLPLLVLLLLVLLLLFAAQSVKNSADAAFRLPRGISILIFVAENCSKNPICQLARIFTGRQQILQFHLRNLLHVGRDLRMLKCSRNDDWHNKLALIVGQSGIHESANLRAAYLLAQGFVQHSNNVQVE